MVWRSDAGPVHQALTELTAIKDDAEFETQMFLIRVAREAVGIGLNQREFAIFGCALQKPLVFLFRSILVGFYGLLRIRKSLFPSRN
jgi:hypothetical protein